MPRLDLAVAAGESEQNEALGTIAQSYRVSTKTIARL